MSQHNILILLTISFILVAACGPDTIFLRPALDTPEQHVKNGNNLFDRGKIEAANAEFMRAKTLDDGYAPAYVGLALIKGHQGDVAGGFETLDQARLLVATPEEGQAVDRGFEVLQEMKANGQD